MKDKRSKHYYRQFRSILKTEVSMKNNTIGINTLAVSVLSYSYAILK